MTRPRGTAWAAVAALVAAAAAAAGLVVVGPPSEARQRRLDAQRVRDLDRLSTSVDLSWTRDGHLPGTLEAAGAATRPPRDPATGEPYAYRVLDDDRYELCAAFDRASDADEYGDAFWRHGAGRQCFAMTPKRIKR